MQRFVRSWNTSRHGADIVSVPRNLVRIAGSDPFQATEGNAPDLFDTRWLELPPRPIDQKVFQDKPPLPAVQRPAAVAEKSPDLSARPPPASADQMASLKLSPSRG